MERALQRRFEGFVCIVDNCRLNTRVLLLFLHVTPTPHMTHAKKTCTLKTSIFPPSRPSAVPRHTGTCQADSHLRFGSKTVWVELPLQIPKSALCLGHVNSVLCWPVPKKTKKKKKKKEEEEEEEEEEENNNNNDKNNKKKNHTHTHTKRNIPKDESKQS